MVISSEKEINKKVNEVLEDMCIYGTIMKKEIKEEKIKNPKKYISTNEALKLETKDQGLFALGLLSKNLEDSETYYSSCLVILKTLGKLMHLEEFFTLME